MKPVHIPSDTGINTVEGQVSGSRAFRLAQEREKASKAAAASVASVSLSKAKMGVKISDKFSAPIIDRASNAGLHDPSQVTAQDVKDAEVEPPKSKTTLAPMKKKKAIVLSFADDEEENANGKEENMPFTKKTKKNPNVETSFLPDRERELQIEKDKGRLRLEWQEKQIKMKEEMLEITYSYWDGSGHRRSIQLKKGTTIGEFLEAVRKQLSEENFSREMQSSSADEFMYVKEDLIIPHSYSFYDLIVTKARGKSGPLFHFDVHDDVRVMGDATVEKDESHPGKVVSRRWYDRNKHIFPSSRWEIFDPEVKRSGYTIK